MGVRLNRSTGMYEVFFCHPDDADWTETVSVFETYEEAWAELGLWRQTMQAGGVLH
jgi:hypothetical protein